MRFRRGSVLRDRWLAIHTVPWIVLLVTSRMRINWIYESDHWVLLVLDLLLVYNLVSILGITHRERVLPIHHWLIGMRLLIIVERLLRWGLHMHLWLYLEIRHALRRGSLIPQGLHVFSLCHLIQSRGSLTASFKLACYLVIRNG